MKNLINKYLDRPISGKKASGKNLPAACAAAAAFLILTAAVFGLFGAYTHTDREVLYLTPLLHDANGWQFYTLENGIQKFLTVEEVREQKPEEIYYLSRVLTREIENSGYTFLRLSADRPYAVFLDSELLYTTCPDTVLSMDELSFPDRYEVLPGRGEAVRCTLPAHYADRTLTIATVTVSTEYGPSLPNIQLSSEAVESEIAMAVTGGEMIPAAGFAATALLLTAVWLFAFLQKVYHYQILLPVVMALLQAFSHLRQFEFLAAFSTAFDHPLVRFIPTVSLLLPLIYLLLQFRDKRSRLLFGCLLGLSSVIAFLSQSEDLIGGLTFSGILPAQNESFYCPLILLLVLSLREAKQGNTEMRLFLTGIGISIAVLTLLYIGSTLGQGYYAAQIATALKAIPDHSSSIFLDQCAVILFLLSALIGLRKIIRYTMQIHTDLALQTERSNQLDRQLSAQKEFYDARLSHEKEIRSLRHDMRGHLNTLATLLDNDKMTEAKKYLDGLAEYHNKQASEIYSSNPYINAILQNYAMKCLENRIKLICHIGVGDEELPATELCLILNNALDNAIEASMTLPDPERQIKVQAAVRQNLFLLRISNPFHGSLQTENGLPITTRHGKEHGYGLSNIRQAAERKGGSMECHMEEEYFMLDVEFPIT